MALSTMTNTEKRWARRAQEAVDQDESWERCGECGRFHPEGFEGECDDLENRLPRPPQELVES